MSEYSNTVQGEAKVIDESTRPLNAEERARFGLAQDIREQLEQQQPRGVLRWLGFGRHANTGSHNEPNNVVAQHDKEINRLNNAGQKLSAQIDRVTTAGEAALKRQGEKAGLPPIDKQREAEEIEAELQRLKASRGRR